MLIDAHCHLDSFEDKKQIIADAKEHGVTTLISCSTDLKSVKAHLMMKELFPEVKIALGLHPSDLLRLSPAEINEAMEIIEKNLDKAVAIGEVGLDYKHAVSPAQRELQEKYFLDFIALARKTEKPLVIHSRFASKEILQLLKLHFREQVLLHWFSGSASDVKEAISSGHYISVGPAVLQSIDAQNIAKDIPLSHMMLESDAPVSFQGKESTSRWIEEIAEKIAELKGATFKEVAETTSDNAKKYFKL